ncbi:hypothetical protein ACLOJK_035244 [Asimina triloba]
METGYHTSIHKFEYEIKGCQLTEFSGIGHDEKGSVMLLSQQSRHSCEKRELVLSILPSYFAGIFEIVAFLPLDLKSITILPYAFTVLCSYSESSSTQGKESSTSKYGWTAAVKRVLMSGSMWRLQECILGLRRASVSSSTSEIWLLGICYKVSPEQSSGFDAIGDSKFSSDVHWGCMLRSSQMLVAQYVNDWFVCSRHCFFITEAELGESPYRRLFMMVSFLILQPFDRDYIEILHNFGDSEHSAFSIHNLLLAGKAYGLAAGSWVGPYAVCRSWETLVRALREKTNIEENNQPFPMTMYIVSGDEDGEQGGAPVVCIENAAMLCSNFHNSQATWAPILLLVPLVLGLDKVNPRYIPLLWATFTFPQSLGILGGKPGASTYIVGVQGDKAIYLDPHEVQPVIEIARDNTEADTSSYHCNVVRQMPLDMIDPSLAIGFYCRDKADFEDFCARASELASQSNGAPLFTVVQSRSAPRPIHSDAREEGLDAGHDPFDVEKSHGSGSDPQEEDWQIL